MRTATSDDDADVGVSVGDGDSDGDDDGDDFPAYGHRRVRRDPCHALRVLASSLLVHSEVPRPVAAAPRLLGRVWIAQLATP